MSSRESIPGDRGGAATEDVASFLAGIVLPSIEPFGSDNPALAGLPAFIPVSVMDPESFSRATVAQGVYDAGIAALAAVKCLEDAVAACKAALVVRVLAAVRVEVDAATLDPWQAKVAESSAVTNMALVLRIPEQTAASLVYHAVDLVREHPATMAALEAGELSWRHACTVSDEIGTLRETKGTTDQDVASFEVRLLALAVGTTASGFSSKARRARESTFPGSISTRTKEAFASRRMVNEPGKDNMSWLTFHLPTISANAIMTRCTRIARAIKNDARIQQQTAKKAGTGEAPGEYQTLTQLRVDIATLLLLGEDLPSNSHTNNNGNGSGNGAGNGAGRGGNESGNGSGSAGNGAGASTPHQHTGGQSTNDQPAHGQRAHGQRGAGQGDADTDCNANGSGSGEDGGSGVGDGAGHGFSGSSTRCGGTRGAFSDGSTPGRGTATGDGSAGHDGLPEGVSFGEASAFGVTLICQEPVWAHTDPNAPTGRYLTPGFDDQASRDTQAAQASRDTQAAQASQAGFDDQAVQAGQGSGGGSESRGVSGSSPGIPEPTSNTKSTSSTNCTSDTDSSTGVDSIGNTDTCPVSAPVSAMDPPGADELPAEDDAMIGTIVPLDTPPTGFADTDQTSTDQADQHQTAEHPAGQRQTAEHPAGQRQTGTDPSGQHQTGSDPTDQHPAPEHQTTERQAEASEQATAGCQGGVGVGGVLEEDVPVGGQLVGDGSGWVEGVVDGIVEDHEDDYLGQLEAMRQGQVMASPPLPRATILLKVPFLGLLDVTDEPAELVGVDGGPVPLDIARKLLVGSETFLRVLTDPVTGETLPLNPERYTLREAEKDVLRAIAGGCYYPNCTNPIMDTDFDHLKAFEFGGKSTVENVRPACKKHHGLKHFKDDKDKQGNYRRFREPERQGIRLRGWTPKPLNDGRVGWITPTGAYEPPQYEEPQRTMYPTWLKKHLNKTLNPKPRDPDTRRQEPHA